jgi:putative NADPH-quinone reductase
VTVLVVYAHPLEGSFVSAVRDRVIAGLTAGGATVDVIDLYADGFDPVVPEHDWRAHGTVRADDHPLAGYAQRLRAAGALVFVYPTWWGGAPAIVKGFVDRVFVNGVAMSLDVERNRIRGRLGHLRDLAVFATHGSPWRVNALFEGEPGKLLVSRQFRLLCSWRTRFSWVPLYGLDRADAGRRAEYLATVEARAVRLGRRSAARRG